MFGARSALCILPCRAECAHYRPAYQRVVRKHVVVVVTAFFFHAVTGLSEKYS